jgi:hypothetical protein
LGISGTTTVAPVCSFTDNFGYVENPLTNGWTQTNPGSLDANGNTFYVNGNGVFCFWDPTYLRWIIGPTLNGIVTYDYDGAGTLAGGPTSVTWITYGGSGTTPPTVVASGLGFTASGADIENDNGTFNFSAAATWQTNGTNALIVADGFAKLVTCLRAAPTCSNNQCVTIDFRDQGGAVLAESSDGWQFDVYLRSSDLTGQNNAYQGQVVFDGTDYWCGLFVCVGGNFSEIDPGGGQLLTTDSMPTEFRLRAVDTFDESGVWQYTTLYLDCTWDGVTWVNQFSVVDTNIESGPYAGWDANFNNNTVGDTVQVGAVTIST